MKGLDHMSMLTHLALTILLAPGLLHAQAPAPAGAAASQTAAFSQKFKAGKPEVQRLLAANDFRAAFTLAQTLLPAGKPVFDKSSVNGVHLSCWNFLEAGQAYLLAFQAADRAGQWEKAGELIAKGLEIVKENQVTGLAPLTEQVDYYQHRADAANAMLTTNAAAIAALKAKPKVEDYEQESLERVTAWDKEFAEGTKWSKFFKYDLDMSARDVEYYEKLAAEIGTRIKSQQADIEKYKLDHPGKKFTWIDAVVTRTYLDSIADKGDQIAHLCRLAVLDPENKKVEHELDVLMGKAAADKKAAPAKAKKH
jgi:hypothetical protein